MQFIDLQAQYPFIKTDILWPINNVLKHGQYIMGRELTNHIASQQQEK